MSQPKITVVTTTYRPWDRLLLQLADLKMQTFREFKWVVVDDLFGQRPFRLEAAFPIVHCLPKGGVVHHFAPARADNTALAYAEGELVYWMNDYVRLVPAVLERHWAIYERYGPKVVIMGLLEPMDAQMPFPPRHFDYSIAPNLGECDCGSGVWQYSAGRNDSAPLKELLALNGLDESFDGDRGGSDVDLAMRLLMNGNRLLVDTQARCFEYAHHADSNPSYAWEKVLPQKGTWDKLAKGYRPARIRAHNEWDIAKARESIVGQGTC